MADRNDSFLREVDEDIRRDQMMQIWNRYGVFIVAGVALLFLGVGAYKWREARQVAYQETTGIRFEAATKLASESKPDDALKAFTEIAKDGPAGYRAVAHLRVAGEHAKAGRTAEALASYEALSADTGIDDLLRDFATLQAALLRLDQADWTEMKNRLTPLVDDSRPWHAPAREALGLAAYKAGQTEEATKLFEQILGDRATTGGLSRRAQEMLAVLTDAAAAKAGPQSPAATKTGGTDATVPAKPTETGKGGEPALKK